MRRCATITLLALLLGACPGPEPATAVKLRVEYEEGWGLDQLEVKAQGKAFDVDVAHELELRFPEDWAGEAVLVEVRGFRAQALFARGEVEVKPRARQQVRATVALALLGDPDRDAGVGDATRDDGSMPDAESDGPRTDAGSDGPRTDAGTDGPRTDAGTDGPRTDAGTDRGADAAGDPCGGDPCDQPPPDVCVDAHTVLRYATLGECNTYRDRCEYSSGEVVCEADQWCGAGRCGLPAWSQVSPEASPPARDQHVLVYDSARQRAVLFGGRDAQTNLLSDTWEWDGAAWTQAEPANSPTPRYRHAAAFDAARLRVVLFGGGNDDSTLADTWEWDGVDWLEREPMSTPPPLYYHAMAYDAAHQRTVLYGGHLPSPGSAYTNDETWLWDGNTWTDARASAPGKLDGHAMAYDAARREVVLYGGWEESNPSDKTWAWDGAAWHLRDDSNNGGSDRAKPTYLVRLAHDSRRGRTVLFGGFIIAPDDYTYEWDGADWSYAPLETTPPVRAIHAMAFDEARQQVVLFGGWNRETTLGDTWLYGY